MTCTYLGRRVSSRTSCRVCTSCRRLPCPADTGRTAVRRPCRDTPLLDSTPVGCRCSSVSVAPAAASACNLNTTRHGRQRYVYTIMYNRVASTWHAGIWVHATAGTGQARIQDIRFGMAGIRQNRSNIH